MYLLSKGNLHENCVVTVPMIFFKFFFSKSNDMAALKDEQFAAMRELEEAHANSLSKMTDIVTELER